MVHVCHVIYIGKLMHAQYILSTNRLLEAIRRFDQIKPWHICAKLASYAEANGGALFATKKGYTRGHIDPHI